MPEDGYEADAYPPDAYAEDSYAQDAYPEDAYPEDAYPEDAYAQPPYAAPAPAPAKKRAAANGRSAPPPPPAGKKKKKKKKKRGGAGLIAAIVFLSVVLLLCGGAVGAALAVRDLDTVYPGITVDGVYLGGLTLDEAQKTLAERERAAYDGFAVDVSLPMEHALTVTAEDAGLTLDSVSAVNAAYQYGRGGGLFANLLSYLRCRWLGGSVDMGRLSTRAVDESALHTLVHAVAEEVNEALLKSEMRVGQYSVNIVKGAHALYIDEDAIVAVLADAVLKADRTPIVYEVDMHEDNEMDLEALHRELTCEAVSATYDKEIAGATPSQVGVTFDLNEARRIWEAAAYGETVAIELQITQPELATEELNNMLFRDLLGEKTTSLRGSSDNRISNIVKACEALSTVVLQPGDAFDYNTTLGERTPENGWLTAPAYANGTVRDEYGGGICQVSSTLFVSALLSNLEITSRSPHYFPVGYLTAGMDATVSWGGPEFRFNNSRTLPVRIKAFVSDDRASVTVQLWGTNLDGSYVDINFSGARDVFEDASLVDQGGNPVATGCQATIWGDLMNADGSIREEDIFWFGSTYHYHEEDIQAKVNSGAPSE